MGRAVHILLAVQIHSAAFELVLLLLPASETHGHADWREAGSQTLPGRGGGGGGALAPPLPLGFRGGGLEV